MHLGCTTGKITPCVGLLGATAAGVLRQVRHRPITGPGRHPTRPTRLAPDQPQLFQNQNGPVDGRHRHPELLSQPGNRRNPLAFLQVTVSNTRHESIDDSTIWPVHLLRHGYKLPARPSHSITGVAPLQQCGLLISSGGRCARVNGVARTGTGCHPVGDPRCLLQQVPVLSGRGKCCVGSLLDNSGPAHDVISLGRGGCDSAAVPVPVSVTPSPYRPRMGQIRDCPCWCAIHTAARCRSTARVAHGWRRGRGLDVAVQLERRPGGEVLALLLRDGPPIWLPADVAVTWVGAAVELVEQAGWLAISRSVRG